MDNPKNAVGAHLQSGQIVQAEIAQTSGDTCFLRIYEPDGRMVEGRLKQVDSLQWQNKKPLDELPEYEAKQSIQIMLTHSRVEGGQKVWFTHERWAHHNPWPDVQAGLSLQEGDQITGWVHGVVRRRNADTSQATVGYLLQLDAKHPLRDAQGQTWQMQNHAGAWVDLMQPDMWVFLPADELPGQKDQHGRKQALVLHENDRVRALVVDATRTLPEHPLVSIQRLRNAMVAEFWSDAPNSKQAALPASTNPKNHRNAAQAVPLSSQSVLPDWEGFTVLVLDDQANAANALQLTLESRKAQVQPFLPNDVEKGWREAELHEALLKALATPADLLLVDDGLPQAHRGEDALVNALLYMARENMQVQVRGIYLMSGSTPHTARDPHVLQKLGIAGALRRPLGLKPIDSLLRTPNTPRWEWQEQAERDTQVVTLNNPRPLEHLLRMACKGAGQDYAVLLAVAPGGRLQWLASAGQVPFGMQDLEEVRNETELRLLVEGRQAQLLLKRGSTVNRIHASPEHVARWQAMGSGDAFHQHSDWHGQPEYLLGVGSRRGQDCAQIWPWLLHAARAELQAQQVHGLFRNNTSALLSGWLVEGFAHEAVHDRQNLIQIFAALDHMSGQARAQGRGVDPDKLQTLAAKGMQVAQALEAKAQRLLRRHRQRGEPVHVPTWLAELQPLLFNECKEQACTLRIETPVPDVTLPMPEWLLTLCLTNLVLNAAKHQANEEGAWARVRLAVQDTAQHGHCLHVQVQDNGWGLKAQALSTLFSPGFSAAPQLQERHGIGLWLSRTLAQEAGGQLQLAWSYRGLGACFELRMPIQLG